MKRKIEHKKKSVNFVSLLVTCVFLGLAVQFSDGGAIFAKRIASTFESLFTPLSSETTEFRVDYSDYNGTSEYHSDAEFDEGGMAGLYKLTKKFIDDFVPKDILMEGLVTIDTDNNNNVDIPSSSEVSRYYRGLVTMVIFLAIFLLFFLLVGLCFCCCTCCGKCRAPHQKSNKNNNTTGKIIQISLLTLCAGGVFFFVVCAFGSNQHWQNGIQTIPKHLNNSVKDTTTFMTSTVNEIQHLLVDNFNEFSNVFFNIMDNAAEDVMQMMFKYTNVSILDSMSTLASKIDGLKVSLTSMETNANSLKEYAAQLNDAIRKLKSDLDTTLDECSALPACNSTKTIVDALQTIDFTLVPSVSDMIQNLDNAGNITQVVETVNSTIEGIRTDVESSLHEGINAAREQVNEGGNTIKENLDNINSTLNNVKDNIDDAASSALESAQDYVDRYSKYARGGYVTLCVILLVVFVLMLIDIISRIFGNKNGSSSNMGAGGQFLLSATLIMFLCGFIMSIIIIPQLLVGVFTERAICAPLKNPDPEKYTIIKLLDDFDFKLDVNITLSTVLNQCYQNQSIYNTLNLGNKFNLDEIINNLNISEKLESIEISGNIINDSFTILNPTTEEILKSFKKFDSSFDLDPFNTLDTTFTFDFSELEESLNKIIDVASTDAIKETLQLKLVQISIYNTKLVTPMKEIAVGLMETAKEFKNQLNLGNSSFSDAIENILTEAEEAENVIRTNGSAALKSVTESLKKNILEIVDGYTDRVSDHIQCKVGLCGPLSNAIQGGINSVCDRVLLPMNGLWFSFFWTIVFYILTILLYMFYFSGKPQPAGVQHMGPRGGNMKNKGQGFGAGGQPKYMSQK